MILGVLLLIALSPQPYLMRRGCAIRALRYSFRLQKYFGRTGWAESMSSLCKTIHIAHKNRSIYFSGRLDRITTSAAHTTAVVGCSWVHQNSVAVRGRHHPNPQRCQGIL
jgi:hypothetical protein